MKPDWNACKRDCLHCPYPEFPPECEELDADEGELAAIETNLTEDVRKREKRLEARRRYYYEHKEESKAYQQRYAQENRARVAAKKREWYLRNHDRVLAHQHAYRDKIRAKLGKPKRSYHWRGDADIPEALRLIWVARKSRGLTQAKAAELLGIAASTLCKWENGAAPPNWEKLGEVFPELREKGGRHDG